MNHPAYTPAMLTTDQLESVARHILEEQDFYAPTYPQICAVVEMLRKAGF